MYMDIIELILNNDVVNNPYWGKFEKCECINVTIIHSLPIDRNCSSVNGCDIILCPTFINFTLYIA